MKGQSLAVAEMKYGFDSPRRSRRAERQKGPLYDAFGKWMDSLPKDYARLENYDKHYNSARKLLIGIKYIEEFSPEEARPAIMEFEGHDNVDYSGLFLSAFYNIIKQREILFDLELDGRPVKLVGFHLDKNKKLVLMTRSRQVGYGSSGHILNYDDCEESMAHSSHGMGVNFGQCNMFPEHGHGVSINAGKISGSMTTSGVAINFAYVGCGIFSNSSSTAVLINDGKCWNLGEEQGAFCTKLAIQNPESDWSSGTLSEDECQRHPRLIQYIQHLKAVVESYRNAQFPKCTGIFDFLQKEIGDEKLFTEKLRGLMR